MGKFTSAEHIVFWVSLGSALLAIIVGYVYPTTGTAILKDFMIFGAGAGIAYVLARAGGRATSDDRVRSLCSRLVQRLGLNASQTRNASSLVLREIQDHPSAEVVAALLDSLAEQAEVSMGDLEEMAGIKIVLDKLVSDALHNIKTAAEDLPDSSLEVKRKILASVNEMVAATPGKIALTPTSFSCPQCGKPLSAIIREAAGSTAHTFCPECSAQVIAHRTREGSVFSKVYSRTPTGSVGSVLCPNCYRPISVNIPARTKAPVIRNCFKCNERIYIDSSTGSVARSEHARPLEALYAIEGDMAVFACPACSHTLRVQNHQEKRLVKASCPKCTILIEAKPDTIGDAHASGHL